jgi:DNA-directed RNA polymerase specialized sigma24 family protein
VVARDIRNLADEEAMQLVGDGNPRAFELIYDRHGGAAFSLAYRMVGNRVAAEDITQEAFLSIWRSRLRYDQSRGSVRTWVLGIVHNRRRRPSARPYLRTTNGRTALTTSWPPAPRCRQGPHLRPRRPAESARAPRR